MKYSKEIVEKICSFVRVGNNHRDAAILAGITEKTFYEWKADERKGEFREALEKAEAEIKARHIQNIRKAAFGDGNRAPVWQASAWWMERKYQNEFAAKWRLEHEGKGGGPISFAVQQARSKLSGLSKEDLKKLIKNA